MTIALVKRFMENTNTAFFGGLRRFCSKNQRYIFFFAALGLQLLLLTVRTYAADDFFQTYACNLLDQVLTDYFGAMVTAVAGLLALVGAASGNFKGAWALLFVSVGAFIYPTLVQELFPNLSCTDS